MVWLGHSMDSGPLFSSHFMHCILWPFAWQNQLLWPFACEIHFCSFVLWNIMFRQTTSRLASVCMEIHFFHWHFFISSYEIGRFLNFLNLKYGMCARKYGPLGHQTDEKRNDIISLHEVSGLHIIDPYGKSLHSPRIVCPPSGKASDFGLWYYLLKSQRMGYGGD